MPGSDPWVEARFEGLRVAACLPPLTPGGPALCVRRHRRQRLTLQQLAGGSRAQAIALAPLAQAVRDGQAILIAGSTDAGKTTLLNALCGEIPSAERVITIEDTPELAPDLPHHLALACDPASGASIRDLLRLALRLRPDRILLGEVRGPEAFDLIQAAMTGHRGMMATIHAVDPLAALARVESLALCAGVPWPPQAVREAVARAFDFVVVLESRAGVRGVRQVVRVCGADPDAGYRVRAVAGPPSPGAGPLQEDGAARRAGFASIECGGSDARY